MGLAHKHSLKLRPLDGPAAAVPTAAELLSEGWVDEAGAAEFLMCSRRRVRALKKSGAVPFIQEAARHRVLYPVLGLRRYMEQRLHC